MDKDTALATLQDVKKSSPKRNFKQSIDLIVVLSGLDLKKTEHQVNSYVNLHYSTGRKLSVCALVGAELKTQAAGVFDEVIVDHEFDKFKDKKLAKQLAEKHDFFVAQANIMAKIATTFGRVFGHKGKMPNPKAGCVVAPNANLKPVYERLQKTINLKTRNQPMVQIKVGAEDQDENEITDNILTITNSLVSSLPNGEHNIKEVLLKLSMGPVFKIEAKKSSQKADAKGKSPKKEAAQ